MALARLFQWLVDGAPGATAPPDIVRRCGEDAIAAGELKGIRAPVPVFAPTQTS